MPEGVGREGRVVGAVATALFCVQLDYFAMNLALPRMATEFGTAATQLQWVISIYMLTLGAFMVPAGRIGDVFGRKRALLGGIALFGLASAACALAPSAPWLIGFRAVQGLGAALIFPTSVGVLTNALPAARAGRAIGLAYGIAALGNAAGPLVGGLLTDAVGWRWIFWLNLPFTAAAIARGATNIAESRDDTVPRRIDVAGLALIVFGVGAFTLAFDRGPSWGWGSAATLATLVGAVVLLSVLVVVEHRVRWPLIDVTLLRDARFTAVVVAGTVSNVAYAVTIFLATLNLQQVHGLEPFTAGLAFLGPSIGAAVGGVLSGRLSSARHPVTVLAASIVLAAVSMGSLAATSVGAAASWPGYLVALTACGMTMGFAYAFTTVATQAVVRPERAGEAAGVTLTSLITVAGVGVAASGTAVEVLQRSGESTGAAVASIVAALAAVLLAAGAVVLVTTRARTAPQVR